MKQLFTSTYLDLTDAQRRVLAQTLVRSIIRTDELIKNEPKSPKRERRINTVATLTSIMVKLDPDFGQGGG